MEARKKKYGKRRRDGRSKKKRRERDAGDDIMNIHYILQAL